MYGKDNCFTGFFSVWEAVAIEWALWKEKRVVAGLEFTFSAYHHIFYHTLYRIYNFRFSLWIIHTIYKLSKFERGPRKKSNG